MTDAIRPDGLLAQHLPGFTYRETQEEMAQIIRDALVRPKNLALEAGTGIGLSLIHI